MIPGDSVESVTMNARSVLFVTILFAVLWSPPSFGQLPTDLGPFALNGCLTFDKNDRIYLVRRSSDFVNQVDFPTLTANSGGNTMLPGGLPDGQLLSQGPPSAVAAHHGHVAGKFRPGRIVIRSTTGFGETAAMQPLGLSTANGFVFPDPDAIVLNSAQTMATLDNTNRTIQSLHEHLLVGFEKPKPLRSSTATYRGTAASVKLPTLLPTVRHPVPTQDELNIVDQVLLDLFLDGITERMNAYVRSLGKTSKADLVATAYGIIKQGRKNGSLLLSEVVAFMLNEMEVSEKEVLDTVNEITPQRFHAACRAAGLLDLNGAMSDAHYAAFVQVVEELDCSIRAGNAKGTTRNVQERLEELYAQFDPEPQPRDQEREFYAQIHAASLDMMKRLEQLTEENGAVSREELLDAVGRLLFDLDIQREGTITALQEQMIVDALQKLGELEPDVCVAVVDAFLSLDATRPTFRGQIEPCAPVCSDPRAWKHDIWFEGFGNFTHQWGTASHQGYGGDTWGVNLGVERKIGRNMVFGAGFSGAFGTMWAADRMSSGENDSYLFTLYGAATRDDWTLSGAVGFSFIDYGTERFADLDRFRSSHDGNLLTGSFTLSRSFQLDQSRLTPFIGFNFMNLREDEFSETVADEDLLFGAKTTTAFMQTLGVRLSGEQKLQNGWIVTPSVSAGWLHDYGSGHLTTSASHGGGPAFVVDGVSRNPNRAVLGFSLGTQLGNRLSVFAAYNGELSPSYSSQTGQLGVNVAF